MTLKVPLYKPAPAGSGQMPSERIGTVNMDLDTWDRIRAVALHATKPPMERVRIAWRESSDSTNERYSDIEITKTAPIHSVICSNVRWYDRRVLSHTFLVVPDAGAQALIAELAKIGGEWWAAF